MIPATLTEALNSLFGLLLIYYSLKLYRLYGNSVFGKGFKYLAIAALLIAIREASYVFTTITGLAPLHTLLTTLTILALAYSIVKFKEQTVALVATIRDQRLMEATGLK